MKQEKIQLPEFPLRVKGVLQRVQTDTAREKQRAATY